MLQVVLHAEDNMLDVGIQLTRDNQSHRNIKHFGPTTLKANISYSLLRYAQVQPGNYFSCIASSSLPDPVYLST